MASKYLQRTEAEAQTLAETLNTPHDTAVILPARGEYETALTALNHLERAAIFSGFTVLVIVVINATEQSSHEIKELNRLLLNDLQTARYHALEVLCVNASQTGSFFAEKQGVGLARKLGADIAVLAKERGLLKSEWIHTTDCDAEVARDYFRALDALHSAPTRGLGNAVTGALHPFRHLPSAEFPLQSEAQTLYDRYLRYYARGLSHAKSPYAYCPVGSTISFTAGAYEAVRGFPKRLAGEDFYFVGKLAQIGKVALLDQGEVQLRFRPGVRVPFGTGKSIATILERGFPVLDPRGFSLLGCFIRELSAFSETRSTDLLKRRIRGLPFGNTLWEAVQKQGVESALESGIKTRKRSEDLARHCHTWFDGLKTLRTLHHFRDTLWPVTPMKNRHALSIFESDFNALSFVP